jgi:hypothetical protein
MRLRESNGTVLTGGCGDNGVSPAALVTTVLQVLVGPDFWEPKRHRGIPDRCVVPSFGPASSRLI